MSLIQEHRSSIPYTTNELGVEAASGGGLFILASNNDFCSAFCGFGEGASGPSSLGP
jgi:hypothetical protein